jgi:glycosyltransferase involved in cell wall biosynthesis
MNIGGAEMRTLELFRELAAQNVVFHFLALSGKGGALDDEIQSIGGVVHHVRLDLRFPWRFLRLLRNVRPDVIDSHVATFSGALLLGAWLAGVQRRIAHFRSDGDGRQNNWLRRFQRIVMVALIRIFATDIVGVSPSALTHGYRTDWWTDKRASVIVNGVSSFEPQPVSNHLRAMLGIGQESVIILHVGRPSVEKNRVHTVRVLSAVRDGDIDAHLVLVGGVGQDSGDISAESIQLGVEAYVHEFGLRRDVRTLMSEADVLLLTSIREGLPGVVLESLSAGTPVVASDLPGVKFIAKRSTGVRSVGLNELASAWVTAIKCSVNEGRAKESRERIKHDFESSVFSLAHSTRRHFWLYLGRDL